MYFVWLAMCYLLFLNKCVYNRRIGLEITLSCVMTLLFSAFCHSAYYQISFFVIIYFVLTIIHFIAMVFEF